MRFAVACVLCVGCSFDRGGLAEDVDLTDATAVVDTATAIDSMIAVDTNATDGGLEPETQPDSAPPDTEPLDTGPVDPLFVECENGTLFGGMFTAPDIGASNGQWASVPTTAMAWSVGTGAPPIRVELPVTLTAETWYVWVSMYTRNGDSDAMYAGFAGGPLRRFYTVDWNKFVWVGADNTGARMSFTPTAGPNTFHVGAGEPGTGCDRVALTRNAMWTPP